MIANGNPELKRFVSGWSEMMVEIWQEKLIMLEVRDTGALLQSVQELPIKSVQGVTIISHKFLEYGLYVDAGTGKEFGSNRNEKGQLVGKNGEKITVVRQAKPWFSPKRFSSFLKLRDTVAEIYGKEVAKTVVSILS